MPKTTKKAPVAYSTAGVVPDHSATRGARSSSATPVRPLMTASARMAKRSSESVDCGVRVVAVMRVVPFGM